MSERKLLTLPWLCTSALTPFRNIIYGTVSKNSHSVIWYLIVISLLRIRLKYSLKLFPFYIVLYYPSGVYVLHYISYRYDDVWCIVFFKYLTHATFSVGRVVGRIHEIILPSHFGLVIIRRCVVYSLILVPDSAATSIELRNRLT